MKSGPKPRPAADRLWAKVKKGPKCWEWQGAVAKNGYGKFMLASGLFTSAHRAMWLLTKGPIPPRVMVCHTCDNRLCVRASHLFLGSASDNLNDAIQKGRRAVANFHPNAKLSRDLVEMIRECLARGEAQSSLAARFKVTQSTISNIKRNKVWRV